MKNSYISSYIKDDESLDLQKVYKEMSEITGFMKNRKQKEHYDHIVGLYTAWKKGNELYKQGDQADESQVPF